MDDLIAEFLAETAESLGRLDLELVKLEQHPDDPEIIGSIFRLVHTIKGTCGFLGLPRLETLAHAAENVLGKFRDRELVATSDAVTLILQTLDRIKTILAGLEATQAEPAGDDTALIAQLGDAAEGRFESAAAAPPALAAAAPAGMPVPAGGAVPAAGATLFDRLGGMETLDVAVERMFERILADPALAPFFAHTSVEVQRAMMRDYLAQSIGGPREYVGHDLAKAHAHLEGRVTDAHFDAFVGHLSQALIDVGATQAVANEITAAAMAFRGDVVGRRKAAVPAPAPAAVQAPPAVPAHPDHEAGGPAEIAAAAQSIRVGVGLLEQLMTMVSELVLVRNQLLQMVRTKENSEFATPLQRLNHITSELQEGVMKTRMQPIGNAWAKLPRLVRDLAHETGKKIDLEMVGAETELDRQVLELIKDPLTHMVRNSCDHGIEAPTDRQMLGKPEVGKIKLTANHEGGQIVIRLSDDGRGIPLARIKAKAVKLGLVSEAELDGYNDQQILHLIFRAGFSTAEQVTNISGRGVGMDVVRSNIEKIGGTVDLQTKEGRGTVFTIRIPLTLAIVSALILGCGGERFAIPQVAVVELVRATRTGEYRIESVGSAPVLRLRDRLLPLVHLRDMLGLRDPAEEAPATTDEGFIVVTQVATFIFGIVVDRVFDTEEIVVKPVAPILRDCTVFAGNTILGDGSVVMILDPNGIAAAAGNTALADDRDAAQAAAAGSSSHEKVPLLLFRAGSDAPKAVPLALVARLEEVEASKVERAEGRSIIQYRDSLMPLITLAGSAPLPTTGRIPVIVFADRERSMGLVVDEILDIFETTLDVQLSATVPGILGTAVVNGQATELVDTTHHLTAAFPDWFANGSKAKHHVPGRRVLVVDDSAFFRNLLSPLLATAGYEVTAVEGGREALDLAEKGRDFDVIVSDIEMPGMDGFALAQAIRSDDRWSKTPIVALSSHTAPHEIDRGRDVGFIDYVPKFDRDGLLAALSHSISLVRGAA